tara:strand:- start:345 stop:995 length:651 start_codon:yes stop_codon:yes gene_type:complete
MSSVNSVSVHSIDEEKLKFRVIIGIHADAVYDGRGVYDINIPIPVALTNSHEYSSSRVKCSSFAAWADVGLGAPTWADISGAAIKVPALELQMSMPSSQASGSYVTGTAAQPGANPPEDPLIETQGFKQLITGSITNQGNGLGWAPAGGGYGWTSNPQTCEPILCGNPFGQMMRIRLADPTARHPRRTVYVTNSAAIGVDFGYYALQMDVEMVPNK